MRIPFSFYSKRINAIEKKKLYFDVTPFNNADNFVAAR